MGRSRRWAVALLCCLLVGVASGCPAADRSGVVVQADGTPVAINCGTWISQITVKDADTGRVVWSAAATKDDAGRIDDVGEVALGELPTDRWDETVPLVPQPRPRRWLFEIANLVETTSIAAAADSSPNEVHRPAGSESLDHFWDQTCTGLPFSRTTTQVLAIGILISWAAATAIIVVRLVKRRSRQSKQPLA